MPTPNKKPPHILRTKLQCPLVAPDFFPRERLSERLDEGRQRVLTLVSAPAGYGKSTLASRWQKSCESACAWISLDTGDNNLRAFLSYVLASLKSVFPDKKLKTEGFLGASALPAGSILAGYLLNDLERIEAPFVLVLDDYHHITDTDVHDFMTEILTYPPATLRLVLLTRRDPPLPISGLRGRGQVTEIRAADLRFTVEEAAGFLGNMIDTPLDENTAALLEKKIEGWATGIRLAGIYLRGQDDLTKRLEALHGSSGYIAEYLFEEVLSKQEPQIRDYLLNASILDRFCAPLCRQMRSPLGNQSSGQPEMSAEQFVDWLRQANLFVISLDDQGIWFRYHHLFRDFLKGVLRKQHPADRIADLHRCAGHWFAENALIEEAMSHLLAAGDTPAAVQLVLDHRHALMNSSQFVRLYQLLVQLPESVAAENLPLMTTRAYINVDLGRYEEIHAYTQKALQLLAKLSPQSETYTVLNGEVRVLQSIMEMSLGDTDNSLLHVQEGMKSLPGRALLIRSLAIASLSVCHQMKGNCQEAVVVVRDALSDPFLPVNLRARIHCYHAIVQYLDVNLSGVMNASLECLRATQDLPFAHTQAMAHYFLGTALYQQNRSAEAESRLLKVLENQYMINPSYLAEASFLLAKIFLSRAEEEASRQVLDLIHTHCGENGYGTVLSICRAFEAEFALIRGNVQQACELCRHADFDARPPIWFHYTPQLTPIKCLLVKGADADLVEVHKRLVDWDERMRQINRKSIRIEIMALLALVRHKQGNENDALQYLEDALALAESGGWIRIFVDLGNHMMTMLKSFLKHNPTRTFARQILDAFPIRSREQSSFGLEFGLRSSIRGQVQKFGLTRRETEIITQMAEGFSNKEMAEKLFISPSTVKTHTKNIFKKLGVRRRMEAVNKVFGSRQPTGR